MFSIFMLLVILPSLTQQMMPYFVTKRALYEVRERPSKTYSWQAFMLASILVELPWNILMAVPVFFSWYYPIGLFRNAYATDSVIMRGGTMFLLILIFLMFTSTFTSMIIAGIEHAETGSNIAQLLFSMCLIFNGYVFVFLLASSATCLIWKVHITNDCKQHTSDPGSAPTVLDLHVPRVAIYLPRVGGSVDGISRYCDGVLVHRTNAHSTARGPELFELS